MIKINYYKHIILECVPIAVVLGGFLVGVSIALVKDDNIDTGSPPIIVTTTKIRMPHYLGYCLPQLV